MITSSETARNEATRIDWFPAGEWVEELSTLIQSRTKGFLPWRGLWRELHVKGDELPAAYTLLTIGRSNMRAVSILSARAQAIPERLEVIAARAVGKSIVSGPE